MFATFAHAVSMTRRRATATGMNTAMASRSSGTDVPFGMSCRNRSSKSRRPDGVVLMIHARSLDNAWSGLSRGRTWPVTVIGVESPSGFMVSGAQNCTGTDPSPLNPGRATPTIVISVRSTRTALPTIAVSPPNDDCHVS